MASATDQYAFFVEGLASLSKFDDLDSNIKRYALAAINDSLDFARAEGARVMLTEVAFPDEYLSAKGGRFSVSRRATQGSLEGAITARQRATSLARFSSGSVGESPIVGVRRGKGGVKLPRAFLMKLKSGNSDTRNNLGLAVRLKKGEALKKSHAAVEIGKGLYLLYGPSVDQVFRNLVNGETAYVRRVEDRLEGEFMRLLETFNV